VANGHHLTMRKWYKLPCTTGDAELSGGRAVLDYGAEPMAEINMGPSAYYVVVGVNTNKMIVMKCLRKASAGKVILTPGTW
jgi:hypothetical protein